MKMGEDFSWYLMKGDESKIVWVYKSFHNFAFLCSKVCVFLFNDNLRTPYECLGIKLSGDRLPIP
jgi:hypothetical protein